MKLTHKLLSKFAKWALSKNPPGGYTGEDDPRWAYIIVVGGDEYLVRILSPRIFGYRLYLHHFLRPDAGRHLHNHPWKRAFSLLLSGSYDEERAEEIMGHEVLTETKRVRHFNTLTSNDYHRVTKLHGDVWTLFINGPIVQDWGFLVDGRHVPQAEFLGKKAK